MPFTEFACRSGGSNLNAGTRTGSSTVPGTAAALTYASGNWVQSTRVFTVASGDPVADGVAVGDFASVYADGSTVTGFVGRVSARDTTTITIDATAIAGTAPTDGTANRTLKIGGAWKGPNAAENFPFNFVTAALTNSSGDTPRVNIMNDAQYDITAAVTHSLAGPCRFQGFSAAYGDLGRATIDGGTTNATLLTISGANIDLVDMIVQNNATGSVDGISVVSETLCLRVCVNNVRRDGFSSSSGAQSFFIECEVYACNVANLASRGGFEVGAGVLIRCISHDNSGSNAVGYILNTSAFVSHCIADSNGSDGFRFAGATACKLDSCDAYNNGGDGIDLANTTAAAIYIESCNLIKNGGYGINGSGAGARHGAVVNCGFGAGTQANTSGTTTGLKSMTESGSVTYANDVTPWVDPADGDFRINLAAAKGAGRGAFLQTQSGYGDPNATVAYPDIGAAQHQDAGGTSVVVPVSQPVFIGSYMGVSSY